MRVLVDTHAFLWFAFGDTKLAQTQRSTLWA